MERILPGEVAWYVTGRFYAAADRSVLDAGYFLHLQGIDGPMFCGPQGEGTAHFTFLARPFTSSDVVNGDITVGLDPVGDFSIHHHRDPAGDFADPATFGGGEEIARLRRVSVVAGATIGGATGGAALLSQNVFSARLVSTRPFEHHGRRYDLRELIPNGVTQWGTMSATPTGAVAGYPTVIPFVGSATAIGGATGGGAAASRSSALRG